jgi:hypothetical protein
MRGRNGVIARQANGADAWESRIISEEVQWKCRNLKYSNLTPMPRSRAASKLAPAMIEYEVTRTILSEAQTSKTWEEEIYNEI